MVCYLQIKMLNLAYFYKTKLEGFFCFVLLEEEGPLLIQSCLFLFLMAIIASEQILFEVTVTV